MTRDSIIPAVIIIAVLVGVFFLERAKWRECRKYHPVWYCIVTGGGGK